jgi:hypothetical protein
MLRSAENISLENYGRNGDKMILQKGLNQNQDVGL